MSFNWKNFLFRLYLKNFFPPDFTAAKSVAHQQQIFDRIIKQLSATDLGRDLKFDKIKSYEDFSTAVPVTQYDFYEAYIEKIKVKPISWEPALQWNQGLSLLLMGDKAKALKVFQEIAASPNHPYLEQSKKAILVLK